MAVTEGGGATPTGDAPAIEQSPRSTYGFGPREQADETRQAQQREANDAIADVNINDVVSREQAGTFVLMGKNFEANADRRNKIFDHWLPPKPV